MVTPKSLHGVQGAARSNRAAPTKTQTQSVNTSYGRGVNSFSLSDTDLTLEAVLERFIRSSVHRSPKTVSTLSERLRPFTAYLTAIGVGNPLDILREHVDGLLVGIVQGLLEHGAVYDAGYASSLAWQPKEQRGELLKGWWENEWPR